MTLSFVTRSTADLLTPLWSVIMRWPNSRTSLLCDLAMAGLAAWISAVSGVASVAAIWGAVGPSACAAVAGRPRLIAITNPIFFMRVLLIGNRSSNHYDRNRALDARYSLYSHWMPRL